LEVGRKIFPPTILTHHAYLSRRSIVAALLGGQSGQRHLVLMMTPGRRHSIG
jgi:hypothetical protein